MFSHLTYPGNTFEFGEPTINVERTFQDTAANTDWVTSFYQAHRDTVGNLGSGSFGDVSKFQCPVSKPVDFVVKSFKYPEDPAYDSTVLEKLVEAKATNDRLSSFIVWSRDFKDIKDTSPQGEPKEKVIMQQLIPWKDVLYQDDFKPLRGSALHEQFCQWLNACLQELERHNLFVTDLKPDNMGWYSGGAANQFRLIDTDGICSGESLRYISSHVKLMIVGIGDGRDFQWTDFKSNPKNDWKELLRTVHQYLMSIMIIESNAIQIARCFEFEEKDSERQNILMQGTAEIVRAQLMFASQAANYFQAKDAYFELFIPDCFDEFWQNTTEVINEEIEKRAKESALSMWEFIVEDISLQMKLK